MYTVAKLLCHCVTEYPKTEPGTITKNRAFYWGRFHLTLVITTLSVLNCSALIESAVTELNRSSLGVLMKKVKKKHKTRTSLELARIIAGAAVDRKAEDVVILDLRGISSFTDCFVIMSGRSTRHVQGLAETVDAELTSKRIKNTLTEGLNEGHWVLLDYEDVVVHIFYHEDRKFYDIEGLWHDAPRVDLKESSKKKKEKV